MPLMSLAFRYHKIFIKYYSVVGYLYASAAKWSLTLDPKVPGSIPPPCKAFSGDNCCYRNCTSIDTKDGLFSLISLRLIEIQDTFLIVLKKELVKKIKHLVFYLTSLFQNPMLCSPGTRANYTTSSSSVLENYFKCTAPKMSTFRVLYNLQVSTDKYKI